MVFTNSRDKLEVKSMVSFALRVISGFLISNFLSLNISLFTNSRVYGVPIIGALYLCANFVIAPMWSRCPWDKTIALTSPSIFFITVSSGIIPISIKFKLCIFDTSVSS